MTTADSIATALRPIAPDGKFTPGEVTKIDSLAADFDARSKPAGGLAAAAGAVAALKDEIAFYAALRASGGLFAGGLADPQVKGVQALLAATGAAGWPIAYVSYALATAYLETAKTMQPIHEMGGTAYFTRMYDIRGERPAKARELGNLSPGDGAKYAGRGYVQLTGKANYTKAGAKLGLDLVGNPDLAMQPDAAAKILIWGMSEGAFTGKKLADYLPAVGPAMVPAFTQARRIINGQDRAVEIATFATKFQAALTAGGWK